MSSGLQHKLYDHEENPPAGVWEKIAAELDDSALSLSFPSRLHQASAEPPAHVWQQIAAALDEPVLVRDYAEKLTELAIAPPPAAWEKIAQALDSEKIIPQIRPRKISPLYRYAAAAAIIGFLAWGGVRLFNGSSGENTVARQENPAPGIPEVITPGENGIHSFDETIAVSDIAASIEEARNDAALEASKKTFAKLDPATARGKIKNAAGFFFNTASYEPAVTRGFGLMPEETPGIDISNRYIILMTPDGNIIRMSKKLKELICCVSGEEQDKDCIDQMKKWRERLANPSASHSSSNFMDILHLVNSMQEN